MLVWGLINVRGVLAIPTLDLELIRIWGLSLHNVDLVSFLAVFLWGFHVLKVL